MLESFSFVNSIKPLFGKSCVKRATHHGLVSKDYFGSLD